jgi:hypothetical protein
MSPLFLYYGANATLPSWFLRRRFERELPAA